MTPKIILAAPAGPTRDLLSTGLQARGMEVVLLNRERIVSDGSLIIEDSAIRLSSEEITSNVSGAIVLDSGYMFPIPMATPSEEIWDSYRTHFDDFLRADRENESLWFSVLGLLPDRVPLVFNSQSSFAYEAMKPHAMLEMQDQGLPVAPFIASNDLEALQSFGGSGELRLSSFMDQEPERWIKSTELKTLPLNDQPFLLQRLKNRKTTRVLVAGDVVLELDSSQLEKNDLCTAQKLLSSIDGILGIVTLGTDEADQTVLVDFSVSVNLESLADRELNLAIDGIANSISPQPRGSKC